MNDLPLLEQVTHPVAVDPDPNLRAEAEKRGWPVISCAVDGPIGSKPATFVGGLARSGNSIPSLKPAWRPSARQWP
jgi:hypothetical protein